MPWYEQSFVEIRLSKPPEVEKYKNSCLNPC